MHGPETGILPLRDEIASSEAVIHWRDHPRWNKHIYVASIPCYIDPGLPILCRDASHLSFYGFDEDSVLSNDAATLSPR